VESFADDSFSQKIAKKLINPSFVEAQHKNIASSQKAGTTNFHETDYSFICHEEETMWKVFTSFRSHFLLNSSLYASLSLRPDKIGVQVRDIAIRPNLKLSLEQ